MAQAAYRYDKWILYLTADTSPVLFLQGLSHDYLHGPLPHDLVAEATTAVLAKATGNTRRSSENN